jgi:predicted flap endonuclease-1-like 5' DNA nuclease
MGGAWLSGTQEREGRTMANIEEIEGIGPVYAEKLTTAGISTVEGLLEAGATRSGRADLADKTGIAPAHILRWVNHADLMRLKGVGKQYAELLEAAGVDSVKELRHRNAANLSAKLKEVNDEKNVAGNTPNEDMCAAWISDAKSLPDVVSH